MSDEELTRHSKMRIYEKLIDVLEDEKRIDIYHNIYVQARDTVIGELTAKVNENKP